MSVTDRSPTVIARLEGREVGFLTIVQQSNFAVEIYVMGVLPDWHGRGVGTAMLDHVEANLAGSGVEFLQNRKKPVCDGDDPGGATER